MQEAFDFAAVAAVKGLVRHCVVVHSAYEMHEAIAAVIVVGMTPACLAGLVAPPSLISYFPQPVV